MTGERRGGTARDRADSASPSKPLRALYLCIERTEPSLSPSAGDFGMCFPRTCVVSSCASGSSPRSLVASAYHFDSEWAIAGGMTASREPIDPGFVRPRFANVDIELDLGADKELVTEGEVVDFPIGLLPVLPVLQLSHLQSIVGLQTAWYI